MDTPQADAQPDLMTAAQVAAKIHTNAWFVTKKCRSGEIRASKPGKAWLISQADLDAYLDAHSNTPTEVAS